MKRIRNKLASRVGTLGLDLIGILMCALAFMQGFLTTHDLDWGGDPDFYRDIAHAQTIRDGYYWADPLYLGETLWYNPLVPALVAGGSWLTNLPVYLVHTRIGAYFNLLAPISFYILIAYLFDRWTAVISTLGFLFIVSNHAPSWASATYSPWLFTQNFVQSGFYFTLAVYKRALYAEKYRWYLAVGILLGITFLGHTAPALILGSIIGIFTLQTIIQSRSSVLSSLFPPYRMIINFGIVLILALIVSIPFLYSIVGHYHLKIKNWASSIWLYYSLNLPNFWVIISDTLFSLSTSYCYLCWIGRFNLTTVQTY